MAEFTTFVRPFAVFVLCWSITQPYKGRIPVGKLSIILVYIAVYWNGNNV